jgi:hypothetical protein
MYKRTLKCELFQLCTFFDKCTPYIIDNRQFLKHLKRANVFCILFKTICHIVKLESVVLLFRNTRIYIQLIQLRLSFQTVDL